MKVALCSISFLIVMITGALAQNPKVVDSLSNLLATKTGADRYSPLYELAFEYIDRDNEKALEIISEAEQAALLSGDSLWIVKSMRVKGQVLSRLERFSESIFSAEAASRVALNNGFSGEQAMIINNLGGSYVFNLRYDKALQCFFETLQLARQLSDSSLFSTALHNIGMVHYRLENYETALDYLLKALELSKLIHDVKSYELRNVSLCYANLNSFNKAEVYLAQSLRTCGSSCSKRDTMEIGFIEGVISYCKGDYELARRQLLIIYGLAQQVQSARFQLDIIHLLVAMHLKQNKIEEATRLLMDGEELISRQDGLNLERIRVYEKLSRVHLAIGNYKRGALYQSKYIGLKDSLYNYEMTTRLMEVESEFKQRENRAIIANQIEIIKLKEEVIARQRHLNILTTLLVIVTVAFLGFLLRDYRKSKRIATVLEQRVKERTRELEMNRNGLRDQIRQKDLIIDRVSTGLREQVGRLKALYSRARSEVLDPIALQYIEGFDNTSIQIERYLFLISPGTR